MRHSVKTISYSLTTFKDGVHGLLMCLVSDLVSFAPHIFLIIHEQTGSRMLVCLAKSLIQYEWMRGERRRRHELRFPSEAALDPVRTGTPSHEERPHCITVQFPNSLNSKERDVC